MPTTFTGDRLANLEYIIDYLKAEDERLSAIAMPPTLKDRQQLMRALLNIREPKPVSDDFVRAQDAELQAQRDGKGVVTVSQKGLVLWQGDITRLGVDAIVNAANSALLGCFVPLHGCIDNAIHSAAGVQLRLECAALKQRLGRDARTGEAFITQGYNLPSRYVVHTVGPIIADGVPTRGQEVELANCYRHCLERATEKGLVSIAFCCISTGVFMFPQRRAAEIAVGAVSAWLSAHSTTLRTVVFNVFKDSDAEIYHRLLQDDALQSPE